MTNIIIFIFFVLVAGGLLAAFLLGKRGEQKKQSAKQAKDYKNEAKKWANSGRESLIERLRRLAKERNNS